MWALKPSLLLYIGAGVRHEEAAMDQFEEDAQQEELASHKDDVAAGAGRTGHDGGPSWACCLTEFPDTLEKYGTAEAEGTWAQKVFPLQRSIEDENFARCQMTLLPTAFFDPCASGTSGEGCDVAHLWVESKSGDSKKGGNDEARHRACKLLFENNQKFYEKVAAAMQAKLLVMKKDLERISREATAEVQTTGPRAKRDEAVNVVQQKLEDKYEVDKKKKEYRDDELLQFKEGKEPGILRKNFLQQEHLLKRREAELEEHKRLLAQIEIELTGLQTELTGKQSEKEAAETKKETLEAKVADVVTSKAEAQGALDKANADLAKLQAFDSKILELETEENGKAREGTVPDSRKAGSAQINQLLDLESVEPIKLEPLNPEQVHALNAVTDKKKAIKDLTTKVGEVTEKEVDTGHVVTSGHWAPTVTAGQDMCCMIDIGDVTGYGIRVPSTFEAWDMCSFTGKYGNRGHGNLKRLANWGSNLFGQGNAFEDCGYFNSDCKSCPNPGDVAGGDNFLNKCQKMEKLLDIYDDMNFRSYTQYKECLVEGAGAYCDQAKNKDEDVCTKVKEFYAELAKDVGEGLHSEEHVPKEHVD